MPQYIVSLTIYYCVLVYYSSTSAHYVCSSQPSLRLF